MHPIININQDTNIINILGDDKLVQVQGKCVTVNNGSLVIKQLTDAEFAKVNDALAILNSCFAALPNLPLQEVLFNNKDNSVFIKSKNMQQCVVDILKQTPEHQALIQNFITLMDAMIEEELSTIQWITPTEITFNRTDTRDFNTFSNEAKQSISQMAFVCMQILAKENNIIL
jgi:hypothetical protein